MTMYQPNQINPDGPLWKQVFKYIHRNIPQLLLYMVRAKINICIWGRGTGKTEGVTSVLALFNAFTMPGGVGSIGTTSYAHLIGEILPELIKTWQKYGLVEGVHFWVRKFPPASLKVPQAVRPLQSCEHAIFFCNGSAIKLFSVNFNALKNGDSCDWMIVEEARFTVFNKLKQMFLCLRGNEDVFGGMPCHKSLTIVTDMPPDKSAEWLFDYRKLMNDDVIQYILELAQQSSLRFWELQVVTSKRRMMQLQKEIDQFDREADFYRNGAVYVSYASTLDNIHVLGEDTIKQWLRSMSNLDARISMLSERMLQVPACFYPWLDEEIHVLTCSNFQYIQQLRYPEEKNWRWHTDLDEMQPLDLGADYNAIFSCLVFGQMHEASGSDINEKDNYHFCKNMFVNHPDTLKMLIRSAIRYFAGFPTQIINFYYDQTAIGEDAQKRQEAGETFDQIVIQQWEAAGWVVNAIYVGQAWNHKKRYLEISNVMKNTDDAPFTVTYNSEECAELIVSCQSAQVKLIVRDGKTRVAKNKLPETDGVTPPVKATHLTEAMDGVFYGRVYFPPLGSSSIVGATR